MKRFFLTFLLLISFPVLASHIVGGEFELIHISGSLYRLNLIIYFDEINGAPGAKDASASVTIYRKRDKVRMGSLVLIRTGETNVPYTQPECSNGEIITTKLLYTSTITLSPEQYNDPEGYFVVWERCCRNYTITNIYSQVPQGNNIAAGQTFYLEFPPVVKDGQPFVNSSPRLFPPLNDYACPFRPYYVDFAGIDDDGDSLVYSMVTPLNTTSAVALPPASPGPFPNVIWRPGYSLNNIINGLPDLRISKEGLLTATPRTQGLFVFAVKIDEFREGVKIGESRRDFQMLVVDACPVAEPPQIIGKKLTDADFSFDENMSVSFSNAVSDEDRCILVRISDPDATKPEDNFSEKISIRAVSLNFKQNVSEILPEVRSATLTNGSTQDFTICFPQCPFIDGGPYQIGIIAFDDACSLPLMDTLKIAVNIQPPPNTEPYFVTPSQQTIDVVLNEGDFYETNFEIRDDDGDELIFAVTTNGFVLADAGFTVTVDEPRQNGKITGKLRWDAYCNIYDFTNRTGFEVTLQAADKDLCETGEPVKSLFRFAVKLPGNADPFIDTDLTTNPLEQNVSVQRRMNESLSFSVFGKDLTDNDFLILDVVNRDSLDVLGISFPAVSGNGMVSSKFDWTIACSTINLSGKESETIAIRFLVVDNANKCRFYKADTVRVQVKVLPPLNAPPQLIIKQGNEVVNDQSLEFTLGQPIEFLLSGVDADLLPEPDLLTLSLIEALGDRKPEGYMFTPVEGNNTIETLFSWSPDCSIFQADDFENNYVFTFRLSDDRCYSAKADTVSVHVKIKDVDGSGTNFIPPNVFTPNGDGCNDYFALEGIDPCTLNPDAIQDPDQLVSLPPDNCISRFESVTIFNRWGGLVFESTERTFRWYAVDQPAGVYYFVVRYTSAEYKGSLSIRF
ncbi:MAG: gliding motility-associated C-terminal domain-containing protein [Cyclobacteriaceae bacterium]|nr:gliding motility-associated C-terminal domain-containing protein [Cyclobacteriaceae bacterium]